MGVALISASTRLLELDVDVETSSASNQMVKPVVSLIVLLKCHSSVGEPRIMFEVLDAVILSTAAGMNVRDLSCLLMSIIVAANI